MIKKEHFKKLNQNDRIEFLLRLERIEKSFEYSLIGDNVTLFILTAMLILLNISLTTDFNFFALINILARVFFIYILVIFAVNIITVFIRNQKIEELESEFFEIKTAN